MFTKKIEEKETNAMKLMIASDIHGSAYYCLEMLDAMKKNARTDCHFWATSCIMDQEMIFRWNTNQKGNQNVK